MRGEAALKPSTSQLSFANSASNPNPAAKAAISEETLWGIASIVGDTRAHIAGAGKMPLSDSLRSMPEPSNETALELAACTPVPVDAAGFNEDAVIPFGCRPEHIRKAMEDFQDWLGLVNGLMHERKLPRLETMLMPANFSSIVGEFAVSSIPKYCHTLIKNAYHNGHPDIIPAGRFAHNQCQHGHEGIEVKGSRYLKAWQGHNPEDTWLMVFVFESSRPTDRAKGIAPIPFRFRMVLGASLKESDWLFAGRSGKSRRTITASVTDSGFQKMMANWIYKAPLLNE